MERRDFLATSIMAGVTTTLGLDESPSAPAVPYYAGRKILIAGGGFNTTWIKMMAQLTGKPRPRICYLPTASADSPTGTITFFKNCAPLNVEPFVQNSFIASLSQLQGWDEVLLSMDGIVCSGGNTLNQQAIWKAQGIDVVLRKAWDNGIVLGGASAGSLCWFEEGTTDSRPKELSIVKCLGFIPGSHSPHYDAEAGRRPLYQRLIGSGLMKDGIACDNDAGVYFEETTPKRFLSARDGAKAYLVKRTGTSVLETAFSMEKLS
jgi:dipeptidase E